MDAARLARLVYECALERQQMLVQLLVAAERSLRGFVCSFSPSRPADQRLAFRELGLSLLYGLLDRGSSWYCGCWAPSTGAGDGLAFAAEIEQRCSMTGTCSPAHYGPF